MRTTLTLEPDVAAALERRRRESGRSFKEEVNHLLRLGLLREREGAPESEPFCTPSLDLGGFRIDVEDVADALERLEAPWYK